MAHSNTLICLLRKNLRISDNPIFNALITQKDHGFTHLLPLYIFPTQQIELSGFIKDEDTKSPYPEARSRLGGFWRCGPHRAKFLAESVWDLKSSLEKIGSGLCIRVGMVAEVMSNILEFGGENIGAVWMTREEGVEEDKDENDTKLACNKVGAHFQIWVDEKYLIDDRDLPFKDPKDLPDVYTTYRRLLEPLRDKPRAVLSTPDPNCLPPFPPENILPPQHAPFTIPTSLEAIKKALLKPLISKSMIKDSPSYPSNAQSVHPFQGGETHAKIRLNHLLSSGSMTTYHITHDKLLGIDCSSKLSAYLALGCMTSRQIHASLVAFEDGVSNPETEEWKGAPGFGGGENEGTARMRLDLLWRDYMRQCTRKFGRRLFCLKGFKQEEGVKHKLARPDKPLEGQTKEQVTKILDRLLNGTTGIGLIDASLREVCLTGYTSNRTRLNTASFLVNYLHIDWRLGAECYECLLVDYDVSSNWGNWQYVAGVGNDPRSGERILNPVKQALDYDPNGEYIKTWVPETRGLTNLEEIFQAWTCQNETLKKKTGLQGLDWVEEPLKKIDFTLRKKKRAGRGRGGTRGRESGGDRGRGYERSRGLGGLRGRGSGRGRGRGYERSRERGVLRGSPDRWSGGSGKEDGDVEAKSSGFYSEPLDIPNVLYRRHSYS